MTSYKSLAFCLLLLLGAGCSSTDPVQEMARRHLAAETGNPTRDIKFMEWTEPAAWTNEDSLGVLRAEFDSVRASISESLHRAIGHARQSIEEAEESRSAGFSFLDEVIDQTIAISRQTMEEAEAMLRSLEGACTGTRLEEDYLLIRELESMESNAVHFYLLSGRYLLRNESESEFRLRANASLTEIL